MARVLKDARPEQVEVLVQLVKEETDPARLVGLADAFAEVAGNATPAQAGVVAERLARAVKDEANPVRLAWLAREFAAAVKGATPASSETIARQLTRFMKTESAPAMIVTSRRWPALRGGGEERHARAKAEMMAQTLAPVVKEEADRRRPAQCPGHRVRCRCEGRHFRELETVAKRLARAMTEEKDTYLRLGRLADAFVAIAKDARPEQVEMLARELALVVKEETDPARLGELTGEFAAVARLHARPGRDDGPAAGPGASDTTRPSAIGDPLRSAAAGALVGGPTAPWKC